MFFCAIILYDSAMLEPELHPFRFELIPEQIQGRLESMAGYLARSSALLLTDMEPVYSCKNDNGTLAYIALDKKEYESDGASESLVYVVDSDNNGIEMGYGEIRYRPYSTDQFFHNKPFVGRTRTLEDFQRKGFGRRRLLIMAKVSKDKFGLPLHSDTVLSSEAARSLWGSLVDEGLAERYLEDGHERFVMQDIQ